MKTKNLCMSIFYSFLSNLLFFCICSCGINIKICENQFEKKETKYEHHISNGDTITTICNVNIYYPSICGLKDKIMEDSVNRILKKSFLENSFCCNDDHLFATLSDVDIQYKINDLTSDFVSITSQMFTNCGMGGWNVVKTYNIDLKNGKLLKSDDIFKSMPQQEYEKEMLKIWDMNKQDEYNKERFSDDCYDGYNFSYNYGLEIAFTKETVIFMFDKNGKCGPFLIELKKKEMKNIINSKYL